MATPGCCDTDNMLLRKILETLPEIGGTTGGATEVTLVSLLAAETPSSTIVSIADTNVAVPGTAVQSAAQAATKGVYITARAGNIGSVYVGGSTVDRTGPTGWTLVPAGMAPGLIQVSNSNQIWVDADNAGDGVGINVI